MTRPPFATASQPEDLLSFACIHCRAELQVSAALAGVRAPCPQCSHEITAPLRAAAAANEVTGHGASLLSRPPLLRARPVPLAPVEEPRRTAVRPVPIEEATPAAPPGRPENTIAGPPLPSPEAAVDRAESIRRQQRALFPVKERGIFEDTPGEGPARRKAPSFRRSAWKRWLDTAIIAVFTGTVLAAAAALQFTEPRPQAVAPQLPSNLNELVAREMQNAAIRRMEAEELAQASVSRYLSAASEQAAASYLLPPPEGMSAPAFPPFAAPLPQHWQVQNSRRIPGTDRYLVVVQPKDEPRGPFFVVEQTESGPRLHSGAITQQSAALFQKFQTTPGEGEVTLYAEARPTYPADEREFRRKRPDLGGFLMVDVRSAFPAEVTPVIACCKPGSEAAQTFARRAHDLDWRPVLVHVRWQRHREAGPFVEITHFIPGTWSGERLLPQSAVTAATSP
jgi:hypothetical protein